MLFGLICGAINRAKSERNSLSIACSLSFAFIFKVLSFGYHAFPMSREILALIHIAILLAIFLALLFSWSVKPEHT